MKQNAGFNWFFSSSGDGRNSVNALKLSAKEEAAAKLIQRKFRKKQAARNQASKTVTDKEAKSFAKKIQAAVNAGKLSVKKLMGKVNMSERVKLIKEKMEKDVLGLFLSI